jgi:N-acyl-D-aspartate/D-glutamate deacylase
MMASQDYTTGVLADLVRRHRVMSLEEAVHLLTEAPARLYGLRDRGRVRLGAAADLVVLDERTVGATDGSTRADLPGGARRLYTEAVGIHHVLVNGREIVRDGRFTDERPGRVLRSGRDTGGRR